MTNKPTEPIGRIMVLQTKATKNVGRLRRLHNSDHGPHTQKTKAKSGLQIVTSRHNVRAKIVVSSIRLGGKENTDKEKTI